MEKTYTKLCQHSHGEALKPSCSMQFPRILTRQTQWIHWGRRQLTSSASSSPSDNLLECHCFTSKNGVNRSHLNVQEREKLLFPSCMSCRLSVRLPLYVLTLYVMPVVLPLVLVMDSSSDRQSGNQRRRRDRSNSTSSVSYTISTCLQEFSLRLRMLIDR
jgi:hypothetical protein